MKHWAKMGQIYTAIEKLGISYSFLLFGQFTDIKYISKKSVKTQQLQHFIEKKISTISISVLNETLG